jgi:(p)ppGpp synthase/HD superfamily hydrolase
MNRINKALEFAYNAHYVQKDDEGKPYFQSHIRGVMNILVAVTDDEDTIVAGILHDTIEDCDVDPWEIQEEFGEDVAELVLMLTHEGEKDQNGYYFPLLKPVNRKIYDGRFHKAVMIKFADRMNNLSRMGAWKGDRRAQYLRKSAFWKTEV